MMTTAFIAGSSMMALAQTAGAGAGTAGTPAMSWRYNGYGANGTGITGTASYAGSTGAGYGSSTGPLTGEPGTPNNISGEGLGGGAGGGDLGGGSGGPASAHGGMGQ
jgi:hypothetical protein